MGCYDGAAMIPARPRLGSHVRARRHVVGGHARIVLYVGEHALHLGEREWSVLRQADGTRDLEGIRLAAEAVGARVSQAHLEAFVGELARLGALDVADTSPAEATSFARDLPVVSLPGYRFTCDGRGGCCRQYDTIVFTPLDQARARAALPDLEPVFLPESGHASPLSAVTRQEGACFYLDTCGRCRIHAAAGPSAKPVGCGLFPRRYVDVGDAIRAVPRLECACAFEPGDAPVTDATRGADLAREAYVAYVPDAARIGPELVPRAELVAFFDRASELASVAPDLAAFSWGLADEVEKRGSRALPSERAPGVNTVQARLAAVSASADRLWARHAAWRLESDFVRLEVSWLRAALARLHAGELPDPREPEDEALYVRAAFFATLGSDAPVEAELRAMALTMWIARAFGDEPRSRSDGAHPIAIVEALARGHGLDRSG